MKPTKYVANFDSAAGMIRALSRFLGGEDFPALTVAPPVEAIGAAINKLPRKAREQLYIWSGWSEAIRTGKLDKTNSDDVAEWFTGMYPERQYPAVVIGSASGALVHWCAALGIPWLPQTFFIPVKHHGIHPDEFEESMEWGRERGPELLDANPDLQLHHMHDPNQDRLMISRMAYFRVKWLRLPPAYREFLRERLAPGAPIIISECTRTFPTVKVGDRHIFQIGALGGATPEEFLHGGERVEDYLQRYGSHRRTWDPPEPDEWRPEAEWGFEPSIRDDIEQMATDLRSPVRRMIFGEPEHPSPMVADLYRWWYRRRRIPASRLVAESFIHLEPYWSLRTGSVPFWMKFNMEPSAEWLEQYLDESDPYEELYIMLFSHGVEAVGLPTMDRWRAIASRAKTHGQLLGVDEERFPRDFAATIRYYTRLKEIPARYPLPGPLTLGEFEGWLEGQGDRYPVKWE